MIRNNLRQLGSILYSFASEVKRRKNFVNIAKIIKQEEQGQSFRQSDINLKSTFSYDADKQQLFEAQFQKPKAEHMSADDHQMNHRIKTAIRCETIYYELRKNKHKLEMKHYALMLCKLLELRRISKIHIVDEDYTNFLKIIEGKIEKMPPEQLVRIVYGMRHESLSRNQLRPLMPIIESIINEFCNTQNNELEPASFQTLRLSTSIKLFHSLCFILQATGSHYQANIKQLLNQTLDYIIFRSMKTKKISKSGEYFPASLKFSFLEYCQAIGAKTSIVKGLILGILVQKQKLNLDQLLDLQQALFGNAELLQRTRNQLFSQKDIHIKYNILYRIEKYISQQTPSNLKKSSNYALLTKKLVEHLERISQLSFEQLNILEMGSSKDEAIYKTLSLFHQAYKNCLIQNFNNLSQKDDAMKFYRQSQNQYALYELLRFFYLKLKKDGVNALRPSTKKQLKEFVNFLCKFYSKLNFLTQSIIIEILVMSNFNSIRPILTQFLEVNTFAPGSIKNQRAHFLKKDKQKKVDKFFEMLEYEKILRENCPVQFQVFMKSNIKNILKFVFKQNDQVNIEKYAYYLAQYCKALPQSNFTSILQLVIKTYEKISWQNRAFNKDDVNTIYKNQDYFLSSKKVLDNQQQLENQSDIFGKRLIPEQKDQLQEIQKIIPTLQSDKQFLKIHFDLENRIRQRIRKLFRNLKFVIIFLENLKLNAAKQNLAISISEDYYVKLLQNFKTQLECLKFEPLLTKENCSEIIEIHQFLKDLWSKTTSDVQVTNEFAIHANESQKLKKQVIDKKEEKSEQNKLSTHQNKNNQNNAQQEIEDEEQSEESQYTEQVTYLKGKDVLDLQVLKYYKNLQQKSQQYFSIKNKQILNEIFLLTSEFTQLPKESVKDAEKIQYLLKKIKDSYFSSLDTKSKSFVNLTSVDDEKVRKQNLIEVLNLKLQSKENRQIYALKVYKKAYPSLKYFGQIKNKSQEPEEIYYVNFTKSRKNIKQKKESKTNEIPKDTEENQKV